MYHHSKGNELPQFLFRTREDYVILNAGGEEEVEYTQEFVFSFELSKVGKSQKCASLKRRTAFPYNLL